MKVILLQDVAKIGRRFEIVEVPTGFAQNKLIPQKLATEATPGNVKRVTARNEKLSAQSAADEASFAAVLESLGDSPVTVAAPANEQGHLFEALRTDRIVEAFGGAIPASAVKIDAPIKTVGSHTVTLAMGNVSKEVTLEVTAA